LSPHKDGPHQPNPVNKRLTTTPKREEHFSMNETSKQTELGKVHSWIPWDRKKLQRLLLLMHLIEMC